MPPSGGIYGSPNPKSILYKACGSGSLLKFPLKDLQIAEVFSKIVRNVLCCGESKLTRWQVPSNELVPLPGFVPMHHAICSLPFGGPS